MKTKRFKMEDGSTQLFTKVGGKWVPAVEYQKQQIAESENPLNAILIGMGKKTEDLVEGVDQLLGMDMYEQRDPSGYEALEEAQPVATGVGEMLGELGQIALPAGAAAKGMKAANMMKGSPILAATLADLTGASSTAFLRDPGEGTRGSAAGSEALWSLLGGGLTKTLAGITPTELARKALDKGDYLTPAYATDSNFINALETAMDVTPPFASATKRLRGEAQQDWRNRVFDVVGKKVGVKATGETGIESFKQIDDAIKQGYKSAFADVSRIPDDAFDVLFKRSPRVAANLNPADAGTLRDTLKKLRRYRTGLARGRKGMVPSKVADSIDAMLRDRASSAEGPLREALVDMRKTFHSQLEPDIATRLLKLDEVYPEMLVLNDAVGAATKELMSGGFSPKQGLQASSKVAAGRSFARGESPLFEMMESGGRTVGKREGGAPLEWFRRLSAGVPSPPGMRGVGNYLIGETAGQRAVKELPASLLKSVSPTRILPAASDEEEDNLVELLRSLL